MAPLVDVVSVDALPGYRLFLTFEDGKQGLFDMSPYLDSGVLKRLKYVTLFRQASVEYGTVVWPGNLDVAPETLWSGCSSAFVQTDGRITPVCQ